MSGAHRLAVLAILACGCYGSHTDIEGRDTSVTPDATDATDSSTDTVPPPPASYVLHEWGVMVVEGGYASMHGPSPEVQEIMADKPVIYLYADEPLALDITVGFASGAATETWPLRPSGPYVEWRGLDVRPGACDPDPFPSVYDNPWLEETCEACALGSCVVEGASCVTFEDVVSKLLFYAGDMPSFRPALAAACSIDPASGSMSLSIENASSRRVEDIWFLYRAVTSDCTSVFPGEACPVISADLALAYVGSLEASAGMGTSVPAVRVEAELDPEGLPIPGTLETWDEWEAVPGEVRDALVRHGLYTDEADAFVGAWDLAMFGILGSGAFYIEPMYVDGGALLYFMDREEYDAHLPLEATPPPAEISRVGLVYQHL